MHDEKHSRYLAAHIAAMKAAMTGSTNIAGSHVWFSHDKLEWFSGYGSRFGIIYVDFRTQQRTAKVSTEVYKQIIRKTEKS